ncbi:MAG: paraquat-inducible protein A [Paracoccaceae bacterium]
MNTVSDPQNRPAVDVSQLIVCPQCDAVYSVRKPAKGERSVCSRCHAILIAPRHRAGMQIITVSFAVVILIFAAALLPFLSINARGVQNQVSVVEAALSFQGGPLLFVSLLSVALILFIPLARTLLVIYVLTPLVFDRPAAPGAVLAFRWSEQLRPWSMAEIFAIGCAVALIKVSDLALVSLGPAFWMFAVLVVLVVVQDSFMCRWSVWNALENNPKS